MLVENYNHIDTLDLPLSVWEFLEIIAISLMMRWSLLLPLFSSMMICSGSRTYSLQNLFGKIGMYVLRNKGRKEVESNFAQLEGGF